MAESISDQFSDMLNQKYQRLEELKAQGQHEDFRIAEDKYLKHEEIYFEYDVELTGFDQHREELLETNFSSQGEFEAAAKKLENDINAAEERRMQLEKQMESILKEEIPMAAQMNEQERLQQQQPPQDQQISDLKILKSAAGYYIGREQYQKDLQASIPYNRLTDYVKSYDHAEKQLEKIQEFKKTLNGIGEGNVKTLSRSMASSDMIADDPNNLLKSRLMKDHLEHDRAPRQLQQELSRS